MPYHVVQGGGNCSPHQWAVIADTTGKTMGCHGTKEQANAQLKALYANEPEATKENKQTNATQRKQQMPQKRNAPQTITTQKQLRTVTNTQSNQRSEMIV